MAISGLVLTLSADAAADVALSTLAADPRFTLGDRIGRRIPVVAETRGPHADHDLWDELGSTPGITHVDVTFVHLDNEPAAADDSGPNDLVEEQHVDR